MKRKARESKKVREVFGSSDDEEGDAAERDDYGEQDAHTVLVYRLQTQLSALEREIEAVADGAQAFQASVDEAAAESSRIDRDEEHMLEEEQDEVNLDGALVRGAALHHALAQDRLKSLLKKKGELTAQLRVLNKQEQEDAKVMRALVEDTSQAVTSERKGKKKVVEVVAPPKPVKKAVSFVQDDDFDAALDAASGLMETVRLLPL